MKEIEVKILESSHLDFEKRLFKLGAVKVFEGELFANFYDSSNKSIKSRGETLRLRKEDEKVFLTHKSNILKTEVKIADELEFEVENFKKADLMLHKLGFKKIKSNRKIRVSYEIKKDSVKFDFDKYLDKLNHIPEFFEIEAQDIKTINKYVKLLGFTKKDYNSFSTKELEKHYEFLK